MDREIRETCTLEEGQLRMNVTKEISLSPGTHVMCPCFIVQLVLEQATHEP